MKNITNYRLKELVDQTCIPNIATKYVVDFNILYQTIRKWNIKVSQGVIEKKRFMKM